MSARFVLGKVAGAIGTLAFVLALNFFLFRVVDDNPVDNLFRGRNLSPSQIDSLEERFGVADPLWLQFSSTSAGRSRVTSVSRSKWCCSPCSP